MGTKHRKYSYDIKKEVVKLYLEGHSARDIADKYEIKNRRRVLEWADKAKKGGYKALESKRGKKSTGKKAKKEESLAEENARLKLEIKYLKKLLDLKRG